MPIFISGSIAIDTVMSCPSPFIFNHHSSDNQASQAFTAAYYIDTMRYVWGGCAANIAYAIRQLGGTPIMMATVGPDCNAYLEYFKEQSISTEYIKVISTHFTAKATIFNDCLGQQITGFYPGAMNQAHLQNARSALIKYQPQWAIVSPDGKQAMLNRSAELAKHAINFIADPGQAISIMDSNDLMGLIYGAKALALNEIEASILETTLKQSVQELSKQLPVLVTLGDKGVCFWSDSIAYSIHALQSINAVDATGCGDSLRGAWLYALNQGWSMLDGIRLGNLMAGYKVQHIGAQGYTITIDHLRQLWNSHYDDSMPEIN